MPKSGLSWGERWSIFLKRKGQKRNRKENIVKKNAQGIRHPILLYQLTTRLPMKVSIFLLLQIRYGLTKLMD